MLNARPRTVRNITTALALGLVLPLAAQQTATTATPTTPSFTVDEGLIYGLMALAVVQTIFIASLSGIMRTLGGPGGWVKRLVDKGGRAAVLVPLVLLATQGHAQAYAGGDTGLGNVGTFWLLVIINLLLFLIMVVQLRIMRTLTTVVVGEPAVEPKVVAVEGPSWSDRLLKKLTRQVRIEEEKDIELHHDYDGIKELDNVLPPWWLWLLYGTIAWSVLYMVNVHVINIWPQQEAEYRNEMAQAKSDVDAYLATLTNIVDEHTVDLTADAAVLGAGRGLYTQFCTPCHGADAAGSESSVGPNLTDAYWLHGGGVKNIFKTIKYGVPEKGMISWKAQLQPAEIRAIANYLVSLQGTGPATQKAPQGDLWSEDAAPADSTAVPPDTVRVAIVE